MSNLIKTETFELSTDSLSFNDLQQYMTQMTSDWNWSKCNVSVENNKIVFNLFEEKYED